MEYTREDLDKLYDEYRYHEKMAEMAKEQFTECAKQLAEKGIWTSSNGRSLKKNRKITDKLDIVMLSTLHEDRYKEIINSGQISIPKSAYASFRDDISDCIESKETVFYQLKG